MKRQLLGIDIGTSACKVAVFDEDGKVLAQSNRPYDIYYPQNGWVEQNAEEWWKAICDGIHDVLSQDGVSAEQIKGIGVDGQSWSAIPIDRGGRVLCNTPIWMDTRARQICDRVKNDIGEDAIFNVAGNDFSVVITVDGDSEGLAAALGAHKALGKQLSCALFVPYVGAVLTKQLSHTLNGLIVTDGLFAAIAIEYRNGQTPMALTGDAPIGTVTDHALDAVTAPLREPLHLIARLNGGILEGIHRAEPLGGCTEDDGVLTSPAVRIFVLDLL